MYMLKICDNIDKQLDKLEFGGESPLTIRAWCSAFRYCHAPLGIDTAKQLNKLEFGEKRKQLCLNLQKKQISRKLIVWLGR